MEKVGFGITTVEEVLAKIQLEESAVKKSPKKTAKTKKITKT